MSGDNTLHFGAVRIRVIGSGNLKSKLYSLDDIENQQLETFTLSSGTNRSVTALANFIQEKASVKIYTENINEFFDINRIIIFRKELWTDYPR